MVLQSYYTGHPIYGGNQARIEHQTTQKQTKITHKKRHKKKPYDSHISSKVNYKNIAQPCSNTKHIVSL